MLAIKIGILNIYVQFLESILHFATSLVLGVLQKSITTYVQVETQVSPVEN